MKDAVLIQQAYKFYSWDNYYPMMQLTNQRHTDYCKKWNMDFLSVHGNVRQDWEPLKGGWAKVELIRLMLKDEYRYIFWVDADAAIVDMDTDLRTGVPAGALGMVMHDGPGTPGPHLNVGVILMENTERTRALIDEWARRYPGTTEFPWHEQGEIHKMRQLPQWSDLIQEIPAKWNSCIYAKTHVQDAVIEAWHGMGNGEERYRQMKEYLEKGANKNG